MFPCQSHILREPLISYFSHQILWNALSFGIFYKKGTKWCPFVRYSIFFLFVVAFDCIVYDAIHRGTVRSDSIPEIDYFELLFLQQLCLSHLILIFSLLCAIAVKVPMFSEMY